MYFIELCIGKENKDDTKEKIIVIDDPISSLSHIYVFNIASLIKKLFFNNNQNCIQCFVMSHNLYFFHELVKQKSNNDQKLFRISKNQASQICDMKVTEIQNDYQAYWAIVKNKDNPEHIYLLANAMRNIIEYFFGFIDKQESISNIFNKEELKDEKFSAFKRYIDRESHSTPTNIFDGKEFDYDNFKEAFRLVFISTKYEDHYNKMMKI